MKTTTKTHPPHVTVSIRSPEQHELWTALGREAEERSDPLRRKVSRSELTWLAIQQFLRKEGGE